MSKSTNSHPCTHPTVKWTHNMERVGHPTALECKKCGMCFYADGEIIPKEDK